VAVEVVNKEVPLQAPRLERVVLEEVAEEPQELVAHSTLVAVA
jgi:hypothetical protein